MTLNRVKKPDIAGFTNVIARRAFVVSTALSISSCATSAQVSDETVFRSSTEGDGITPRTATIKKAERPKLDPARPLIVVYPGANAVVPSASSFIIGSTYPGFGVSVNGQKVLINKEGFFAHVVNVEPGNNKFDMTVVNLEDKPVYSQQVTIQREKAKEHLSQDSFQFIESSVQPKDNRSLNVGEIIEFSVKASPGSVASVQLGKKRIALSSINNLKAAHPLAGKGKAGTKLSGPPVNRGMDAAYGQVYQRYPATATDVYVGLYRIESGDNFEQEHPVFLLQKGNKSITLASPGTISIMRQPLIARTAHDDTITRVAPDLARLTQLPQGVRLLVDGIQGENIRCRYSPNKHVWIKKEDLEFEESGSPAPEAVARTIQVKQDNYGETVVLPLSQRLPFLLEQNIKTNHLNLKIFGVAADTDWVYQAPDNGTSRLIDNVTWKQPEDNVYQIDIDLKGVRQWGYFADFDGTNLNIHIKYPPRLKAAPAPEAATSGRLQGLSVCIDPGHGGKETGAIGPSAVREAEMNLAIALKFRDLLIREGATVFMTRVDDTDVSLNDRVDFARSKNVDMLISVHNNALPDGRNPNTEHGTSTYWYHPQSQELAGALRDGEQKALGFPDKGARYQNLALCRPTKMQAVLVEVGFVCNPDEYAKLINSAWQDKAAQGMVNGLITYLGRD